MANRPRKPRQPVKSAQGGGTAQKDRQPHWIEWAVSALSALVIIVLAGFILFEAVTKTGQRPDISFEIVDMFEMGSGLAVEVVVRNEGDVTVSNVEIAAEAGDASGGSVTLDYLAAQSEAEIGFGFAAGTDPETIVLRLVGYSYP